MAKPQKTKQMHANQIAAAQIQFENYKDFIVQEFVDKFGGSYQTAEGMKGIWRNAFVYRPECEKFLIEKTKMFLFLLENNHDNKSPYFLRNLVSAICDYLSVYVCKKGIKRNDCVHQLRQVLLFKNTYVQSQINKYHDENRATMKQKHATTKTKAKQKVAKKEDIQKKYHKYKIQIITLGIYVNEETR